MHSCVLKQRLVLNILINFHAEHSDAEILLESKVFFSEIEEIDTKNKEIIVSKIQSWRNK